jgi:hypothetical protein
VRTIKAWIQADVGQPAIQQARILPGRQMPINTLAAREEKLRRRPSCRFEVGIDCLASLLGEFKLDGTPGLLLPHAGAINRVAARGNISNPEADQIAAAQFAVNAEVEERQIAGLAG